MIKKLILIILFSSSLFAGVINIAVAANVSYAMDELIKEFNRENPDIKVKVVLGSSGKLTALIKNGAPYALFMSANMNYPQALYDEGIATTKPIVYAQGSLAYFSSKNRDFSKGMNLLQSPTIKKIAVANPLTAPYGKATIEAIKSRGIYEKVVKKFVYAEGISQTVSYAVTTTDMGIIAKSSLFSPRMIRFKKGINWVEVNPKLYTPIDQGIVILKDSIAVRAFYTFMLSNKAKKILKDFGYIVL